MEDLAIIAQTAISKSREKKERLEREMKEIEEGFTPEQKEDHRRRMTSMEEWDRKNKEKYARHRDKMCLRVIKDFISLDPIPGYKTHTSIPASELIEKGEKVEWVLGNGKVWEEMVTERLTSLGFFVWETRLIFGDKPWYDRPLLYAVVVISLRE